MTAPRHALAVMAALALPAAAFDIPTPDPDLKVRLDLTPKFSAAYRVKNPSQKLTRLDVAADPGSVNEDDGDHNFNKGLVSRRFDLLGEFDIAAPRWGARVSGSGWYDGIYRGRSDYEGTPLLSNGTPLGPVVSTSNNFPGQAQNEFLPATRRQHGRDAELLDTFAYVKGDIGGMTGTLRVGRQALLWGESLFFGQNGIAQAQGPIDISKIVSVPGWQFKEVLLPVEQVFASLQVAEGVSLGAYYQLRWRKSRIPGVGSYFSNQDYVGTGTVNFGNAPDGSPIVLVYDKSADLRPKHGGQGGVQLRWSPVGSDYEFGFYVASYHSKTPEVPVFDFVANNVHLAYAKGIRTAGASVTSSIGQLNWAVEASLRDRAPLTSDPAVLGLGPILRCGNGRDDPCYAVGRTAHLQASGIYVLQPTALWQGGAVLAELAWNRRLKVTRDIFAIGPGGSNVGLGGLDPNTTKNAFAFRTIVEPQYFQVLPGLDVSLPLTLGWNFGGRSSSIFNYAGGASNAGDYSIGIKGRYQTEWVASLSYNGYFGKTKTFTENFTPGSGAPRQLTFAQSLRDRGYVAFSASRTF